MPDPILINGLPATLAAAINDSVLVVLFDPSESAGNKTRHAALGELLADVLRTNGTEALTQLTATTLIGTNATINTLTLTDGVKWNTGEKITKMIAKSVSAAPADITAGSTEDVAVTVTGAATTDFVLLAWAGALPAGLVAQAWPSAADTVTIRFTNTTASTITGATHTARIMALAAA